MSRITNLILTFSITEQADIRMEEVNSFEPCVMHLTSIDHDTNYEQRKTWYGGSKYWVGEAYFGAINHLPLTDFLTHLRSIKWSEPGNVQLIIRDEDEGFYKIINVFELDSNT